MRAAVESAAARGEPGSQLLLAEQLASEGDGPAAVAWLARAVKAGHAQSFALLGAWQVLGYLVARNAAEGVQRLEIAARQGDDSAAAFLANSYARGFTGIVDWPRAVDWLVESARLGNARALTQVALLQADQSRNARRATLLAAAAQAGFAAARSMDDAGDAAPIDLDALPWPALRGGIDIPRLTVSVPPGNRVADTPRIETFTGVASADFCRYVIAVAESRLEPAMVNEPHRGRGMHEMRTNCCMSFGPTDGDLLLQVLNERIARLAGMPVAHQEDSTVLRYRPGEIYDDHFDYFDPDAAQFRDEIERHGQREVTALIFLGERFEGGETEFPQLGWRFKGNQGDAIIWRNVRPDGSPEPRSLHAGRPPTNGEKWVLSKWIRSKPQSILRQRTAA